jgi:hypothetical protein
MARRNVMKPSSILTLLLLGIPLVCTAESQRGSTAPVKGFFGGGLLGAVIGGATKSAKGAGYGALVGAGIGLIGGLIAKNRKENRSFE